MHAFKRGLLGTSVLVVAALGVAGCSADNGSGGGGDEQVNLVVWESLVGRSDFIKAAGEAFTEQNPNVTIEYKNVELADSPGQIALDGPAGVGADVFAAPSNVAGDLVTAGHVLPVADQDALRESLVDGAIQSVTYEDELWAVPVTVDTYALFYNKELVTEVPATWDDVIEFSKQFSADNPGSYGIGIIPEIYYASSFAFSAPDNLLFGPNGADVDTPNTDTDATEAGLERFAALREVFNVPAADLDASTVDNLFSGGQSAMTITGAWNIPLFEDAGLDFGIAALPALEAGGDPSGSFANSRAMFVSAYSEHPDEAQAFAAFLATPEMLTLAHEMTGSVPSADIEVDSEATQGMIEQGKYAFATPVIPQMKEFWTSMDSAVANIWDGADIRSELDAATQVINAQ